jgi:beta-lactamase class A
MVIRIIFLLLSITPFTQSEPIGDLYPYRNEDLQRSLVQGIGKIGLWGPVRKKILGITVVDLSIPYFPRVAELNGNTIFYGASLPKIIILWGLFRKVESGEVILTREILDLAHKMIRFSSNEAASSLYNLVGAQYLLDLILKPPFTFYDPLKGGGIWLGKEYGEKPALVRDPIGNYSHAATSNQVARFYYLFNQGRLVGPRVQKLMEEALTNPGLNHKFVRGLHEVAPNAYLLRKSGSWGDLHADSVLVKDGHRKYIVVAWMRHVQGYLWLEDTVKMVHTIVRNAPPPPLLPPNQTVSLSHKPGL